MEGFAISQEMKNEFQKTELKVFRQSFVNASKETRKKFGINLTEFNDNLAMIVSKIPWRLINKIIGPFENDFLDKIEEILTWFEKFQDFCCITVIPRIDNIELINNLTNRGFKLSGYLAYWVKIADNISIPKQNDNLKLELVNKLNIEEFVRAGKNGFEIPKEGIINEFVDYLFRIVVQIPNTYNYLTYDKEKPVGTGSLFMIDEIAYIANGSVIPKYRGRKIQQTMILQRINKAKSLGAKYVLTSTDLDSTSGRNMERLGFQLAFVGHDYVYNFKNKE